MAKLNSVLCAVTLLASLSGPAMALTSATINIDTFATGSVPGAPTTALVATLGLTQNGGNVDFSLSNSLGVLSGSSDAFLSQLLFSFDGTPSISTANFGNFGGTQLVQSSAISLGSFNNAGYDFAIDFGFPTANNPNANPNRFVNGEFATWTITGVTVDDFLTPASGNNGELAMVHLQGFANGGSLKYTGDLDDGTGPGGGELPEPGTLALVALGLLAAGWRYRKPS